MIQLKQVAVGAPGSLSQNSSLPDSLLISDVTLSISAGDTLALYGPSGGGKSTLLKLLLGGYRWVKGDYIFNGQSVNEGNIQQLRQTIAYIPQLPDLGSDVVLNYLKAPFSWRSFKKQVFDYPYMLYWLDRLELQEKLLHQSGSQLSGGQRQRFAIVRALMTRRQIIIADEPTSALDASSSAAVQNILLSGEYTLVSAAHDQGWISQCQRKVKIEAGRIIDDDSGRQYFCTATHEKQKAHQSVSARMVHSAD